MSASDTISIASWNVNSVKARIDTVLKWIDEAKPDVVGLQEIKTMDDGFPALEFETRGYHLAVHGQKSYNGVAILSKYPMSEVQRGLAGNEEDDQARYVEALIEHPKRPVRFASIYLPNGNPVEDGSHPKYTYKLDWYARLRARAIELLAKEEICILGGDYNTIPRRVDTHDPDGWWGDALFRPETLDAWQALLGEGYTDAFAQMSNAPHEYTFWDYQGGAWPRNHGIRIDHLVCSPQAIDRIEDLRIDKHVRDWPKPSDHVPIVGTFAL
jgi:exodeoxyribonuclease-3